jgi:hypothetical protein
MKNLQEMVDDGETIYVINRSGRALGKAHVLVIEFPHPTGGRGSTVKIPPIKHPINITRRVAPPSAIPLSTAFNDWVNRGVLEIVPEEKAREILKDPEVRASVAQAYRKLDTRRGGNLQQRPTFKVRNGGDRETHGIADLDDSGLSMSNFQSSLPPGMDLPQPEPQGALEVSAETIKVDPKIVQFCVDLQTDSSLKGDYLLTLKGWDEEMMSDDDIGYMLSQLSAFDSICTYLRSIKAARIGGDDHDSGKRSARRAKRVTSRKVPSLLDDDDV